MFPAYIRQRHGADEAARGLEAWVVLCMVKVIYCQRYVQGSQLCAGVLQEQRNKPFKPQLGGEGVPAWRNSPVPRSTNSIGTGDAGTRLN